MPGTRTAEGLKPGAVAEDSGTAVARVLRDRLVTPLFQPIVDLSTGAVVGVEALARGPAGTALERPDQLFAAAHSAGLLPAMDMLCAEQALESAFDASTTPPLLFINAEPAALDQPLSARMLHMLLSGLPFRIMIEYTERALATAPAALLRIAGQAHQLGNGIALDDVGADPMSLAFLPFIEPDVIKLDMHLLRNPSAAATIEVCRIVNAEARRTGAIVIAEGIETTADVATAKELGANWGQGWHFGRPAPLADLSLPPDAPPSKVREPRPDLYQAAASPFEVATAGLATPATKTAALQTLERMSKAIDVQNTVVLGSYSHSDELARWLGKLGQSPRQALYTAVLHPDGVAAPFSDESCLVVVTPDYAAALCRQTGGPVLHTQDRDTVASIGRVLLHRPTPTSARHLPQMGAAE